MILREIQKFNSWRLGVLAVQTLTGYHIKIATQSRWKLAAQFWAGCAGRIISQRDPPFRAAVYRLSVVPGLHLRHPSTRLAPPLSGLEEHLEGQSLL